LDSEGIGWMAFSMKLALKPIATVVLILLSACQTQQQNRIPTPAAPVCSNQNLTPEALFNNAKRGVAVVSTDSGSGSAFVVRHQDGNTLLITNAHVVEGVSSVTLKWADGVQDTAAVLSSAGGSTPQTDLALLEVKGLRGSVLNLKSVRPNVGADIVAIGTPKGLEFSLTRGVVSSLRDDGEILQIDAPINPGNSGGPVLDRTGCVVGVATFKLEDSEGLNFALASSVVESYLRNPAAQQSNANQSSPTPFNSGGPEIANSAAPTCWFQMYPASERLEGFSCSISSRKNANGHDVFDIVEPGGLTRTVVLWRDKTAEVLLKGRRYEGQWAEDEDGDIRVNLDGGVFAFRYQH